MNAEREHESPIQQDPGASKERLRLGPPFEPPDSQKSQDAFSPAEAAQHALTRPQCDSKHFRAAVWSRLSDLQIPSSSVHSFVVPLGGRRHALPVQAHPAHGPFVQLCTSTHSQTVYLEQLGNRLDIAAQCGIRCCRTAKRAGADGRHLARMMESILAIIVS